MDQWWAYRAHPTESVKLYDITKDVDCENDLAANHPDIIERVISLFNEARVDSEFYINPGESTEGIS